MPTTKNIEGLVSSFRGLPMVVVGDLVADRYVFGKAGRISREAPVPIIDIDGEEIRPGGGANTAVNMAAMGADVTVVGVVGKDAYGGALLKVLKKMGVNTAGVLRSADVPTITKTRVMAGDLHTTRQQVIRLDRGKRAPFDNKTARKIASALRAASKKASAVALSDYGFGIAHDAVLDALRKSARTVPVVADSRFDLLRLEGMTVVAPNEPECEAALAMKINGEKDIEEAAGALLKKLRCRYVLITRGNKGMALYQRRKKPLLIPTAREHEAVDVTGAGDTVVAAFSLALAAGGKPEDATRIANHAAGISVLRSGAVAVTADEIIESITT